MVWFCFILVNSSDHISLYRLHCIAGKGCFLKLCCLICLCWKGIVVTWPSYSISPQWVHSHDSSELLGNPIQGEQKILWLVEVDLHIKSEFLGNTLWNGPLHSVSQLLLIWLYLFSISSGINTDIKEFYGMFEVSVPSSIIILYKSIF